MIDDLLVSQGLSCGTARWRFAVEQSTDLLDQPVREHVVHPPIDSLVEPLPGRRQPRDLLWSNIVVGWSLGLLCRERLSGQLEDLQCSHQSTGVVGMESGRGVRVDFFEFREQPSFRLFGRVGLETFPDCPVGRRAVENTTQNSTEIESRAADEQRHPAVLDDLPARLCCGGHVIGQAEVLVRVEDVEQVMRDAGPFG
ncbi:MAG: hypothetical protein CM1200mP2_50130 [Planctomycetaceae bacterium]|nr:MAG: hypothetical protein CM1200mP2_50130 [Planctomycetaceae bacterium]